MAGLFESLGIDKAAIEEATGFTNPPDGLHSFEITEAEVRNGTSNKPDTTFYVIDYDLEEHGHKLEFFTVAEDGEYTTRAEKSLGFLKRRLRDLGVDWDSFDPEETDLTGISGVLKLESTKGKDNKVYQNIRSVDIEEIPEDADPSDYDDGSAAQDAAIKRQVQAKRAEREAAPAKAPARRPAAKKPVATSDAADNPFA